MDYFEKLHTSGGKRQKRRVMRDIIAPSGSSHEPLRPETESIAVPRKQPLPPEEILPPIPPSPRERVPERSKSGDVPTVELGGLTNDEPTIHTWEPRTERRRRSLRYLIIGGALVLLLLAFILPTFAFPTFAVTVVPKLESAAIPALELNADTDATETDVKAKRLPALLVTLERSATREYDSTGKKFIKERARGTVTIMNAFSSGSQVLVSNTRLQDSEGRIFRLTRAITVPGATVEGGKTVPSSIAAEVVADEIGERYNIGPTEFRIPGFRGTPKYDGFTAKSDKPMSGGYEGEARVVTADDLKRASEDLTAGIVASLKDELAAKIPAGDDFIVPDGAREVAITAIDSPKPDEHRERFTVGVRASGNLFAIRRSHLTEVLATTLPTPPPGTTAALAPTQATLVVGSARVGASGKDLRFTVSGELSYYFASDPTAITTIFTGKDPDEAIQEILARPEIDSVRIKRFPRWLWSVPTRVGGLRVEVALPVPPNE